MNTSSIFAFLPLDIKEEVVEHLFENDVRKNKDILDVDFIRQRKKALLETFEEEYVMGNLGLCDPYEVLQNWNDTWGGTHQTYPEEKELGVSACIIPSIIYRVSRMSSREWIDSLPPLAYFSDESIDSDDSDDINAVIDNYIDNL